VGLTTSVLRIPADTEQVRVARLVAGSAARRAGVDPEDLEDVRLATGEAVGRAVLRHQAQGCPEPVTVELREDVHSFEVAVVDRVGDAGADEGFAMAVIQGLVPHSEVARDAAGGQRLVLRWML
jgi:anti-sigma regulatory factor (Ser/Thr protein kinase)